MIFNKKKFESFIQPTAGCWYWNGRIDKRSGRGVFEHRSVCVISYELSTGKIPPKGMIIKQTCNNKLCCNPNHLELNRLTYGWLQ